MPDYNSIALANASKGWFMFPVQQNKVPYEGFKWTELSTNDVEQIAEWIIEYPDCRWALDLGKNQKSVVDFDNHPDKPNGFETVKNLKLPLEAMYSWPSLSGTGQHNWYDGAISSSNGIYPGIDRKSNGGYIVTPYELPMPEDIYQPLPKEYAIERIRNDTGLEYAGTVRDWLESYWGLAASAEVLATTADFVVKGFTGNSLLYKVIVKYVFLALEGHGGVPEALEHLEKVWLGSPHSSGDPKAEWNRALARAIAQNGGGKLQNAEDEENPDLENLVKRKKLNREADAIVDAMYHQGGERLDLDAADKQSSHLIKDFFVEGGINVLFGNSNTGKTFAYMDMWASACMLREWKGFSAKPFKALFVMGEGAYEFKKRAKVWCDHHNFKLEDLLKYAVVWDGGVLSSLEERKKWKEVVEKDQIEAVFWDTWAAVAGLENEDAAGPTGITLNNARSIGLTLTHIFVHHPPISKENETQQRMRGSSALFNRSDAVINLAVDDEFASIKNTVPAEGTKWLRISTESQFGGKKRNGRKQTLTGLYFVERVYGVDEFGESDTALVMEHEMNGISKDARMVLQHLGTNELTIEQWLNSYNTDNPNATRKRDWANNKLKAAINVGLVERINNPNPSVPSVYKATKPEGIWSKW